MKTFKLISLQLVDDHGLTDIPIYDGLMINKEDEQNRWLMEAYMDSDQFDFFEKARTEGLEVTAHVVISKKGNEPAAFTMKVLAVRVINGRLSVLSQGSLKRMSHYAELLLSELIENGLSGDALLREFREKMATKPKLKTNIHS